MQKLSIISGKEGKTRTWTVDLIANIVGNYLWEGGSNSPNNTIRPVWMVYAASEQQSRMFSSNFLQGVTAELEYRSSNHKFQLLKSAGYKAHTKKLKSGAVTTTVYLPEFFWIDPGMVDPEGIKFILLTSQEWRDAQKFNIPEARVFLDSYGVKNRGNDLTDAEIHSLLSEAVLFHMYLDRRSRYPMPAHPHFSALLLLKCLASKLAQRSDEYYSYYGDTLKQSGLSYLNIPPVLAFKSTHDAFGEILAEVVNAWHA